MQILGVDFSGAQTDRNTWLARGSLRGNTLSFDSCRPVKRAVLKDELAKCAGPTVAALDFPFSVPREFARFWQRQHPPIFETPIFETMPDLWAAAAGMDWNDFSALRDAFVARYGELKRSCDPPESYSCLHRVNPNMVPMTFRGMQMLHRLWAGNTANPMSAPPLPDRSRPDRSRPDRSRPDRSRPDRSRPDRSRPDRSRPDRSRPDRSRPDRSRPDRSRPDRSRPDSGPDTVLLEVMPGAVLRRMGLPFKGYKNGARAPALRRQILEDLPGKATPVIVSLAEMRELCLAHHDGLDAVVAAIAAALWAIDPSRFPAPPTKGHPDYEPAVLLEGWLYAPGS